MRHLHLSLLFCCLLAPLGCEDRSRVDEYDDAEYDRQLKESARQGEAVAKHIELYDQQMEKSDKQLERVERQQEQSEKQTERMNKLLLRWEQQADRQDKLLDRQESQTLPSVDAR